MSFCLALLVTGVMVVLPHTAALRQWDTETHTTRRLNPHLLLGLRAEDLYFGVALGDAAACEREAVRECRVQGGGFVGGSDERGMGVV